MTGYSCHHALFALYVEPAKPAREHATSIDRKIQTQHPGAIFSNHQIWITLLVLATPLYVTRLAFVMVLTIKLCYVNTSCSQFFEHHMCRCVHVHVSSDWLLTHIKVRCLVVVFHSIYYTPATNLNNTKLGKVRWCTRLSYL